MVIGLMRLSVITVAIQVHYIKSQSIFSHKFLVILCYHIGCIV